MGIEQELARTISTQEVKQECQKEPRSHQCLAGQCCETQIPQFIYKTLLYKIHTVLPTGQTSQEVLRSSAACTGTIATAPSPPPWYHHTSHTAYLSDSRRSADVIGWVLNLPEAFLSSPAEM